MSDEIVGLKTRIPVPAWLILVMLLGVGWGGCFVGRDDGQRSGWSKGFDDCEAIHEKARKDKEAEDKQQQELRDAFEAGRRAQAQGR
jgi:hypothetical protein